MKKFDNYKSNLSVLVHADSQDTSNEFIIGGIIDKFFIQFELSWKVLKELLAYEGIAAAQSGSPREIIKEAYKCYPFIDEKIWLSMLSERNNLAHIYDQKAAKRLVQRIIGEYISAFVELEKNISEKYPDLLDKTEING